MTTGLVTEIFNSREYLNYGITICDEYVLHLLHL